MTSKAWLDGGVQKRLPGDDVTETRLGASRMGAEVSAETDSARSTAARRRLKWGIVLALVSVLLGVAAQASAAWVSDSWPEVLVYQVTASSGDSVVVEQSGFDPQTYSVYSQKSWGLWQRSVRWLSATEAFDPNGCTLTGGSSDLVLHCGVDDVIVPRLGD
jgi:hypothetical protein